MSLKCRFFGAIVRALDKVANSGAGDLGAVALTGKRGIIVAYNWTYTQ